MYFDEKDYIMRMIKQMVRVLMSMLLGKKYIEVEIENENKYEVSGKKISDYKDMIDEGLINEAENELLENIDYSKKDEVAVLVMLYDYIGMKSEEFLLQHRFSKQEVQDGLKRIADVMGYGEIAALLNDE